MMVNPRKNLLLEALEIYRESNLAYIDCWIFTISKPIGIRLETFDKDLKKLSWDLQIN